MALTTLLLCSISIAWMIYSISHTIIDSILLKGYTIMDEYLPITLRVPKLCDFEALAGRGGGTMLNGRSVSQSGS